MSQGDQKIVLTGDCRDYLNRMTPNISDGMAFVVSSWKPPTARWLQGDRCNEECVWPVHTVFENLEFWTHGGKEAQVDLTFGKKACGNLNYGTCGDEGHCSECAFSFPSDDDAAWQSEWGKCRCKDTNHYSYGNPCDDAMDKSKCGADCEFCNRSWSPDDVDRWLSDDMQCRCVPPQPWNIEFGNHVCGESNNGICGDNCDSCRWSWPKDDLDRNKSRDAMCRCADGRD